MEIVDFLKAASLHGAERWEALGDNHGEVRQENG